MEKNNRKQFLYKCIMLVIAATFLRVLLRNCLNPIEEALEALAFVVQYGERPVGEAVLTFCQEVFFEIG